MVFRRFKPKIVTFFIILLKLNIFGEIREKIKTKFKSVLKQDFDENYYINKIEVFFVKFNIIVAKSFEDYFNGKQNKRRLFLVVFHKLILFIFFLRYTLSAVYPKQWIREIVCDFTILFTNARTISLVYSLATLCALFLTVMISYQELYNSDSMLRFLNDIRKGENKVKLNSIHQKMIENRFNFITHYLLHQMVYSLTLFAFAFNVLITTYTYFVGNSNYSLINIILWNVGTIFWCNHFFAIFYSTFVCYYFANLFVKLKFKEINDSFKLYQLNGNRKKLMKTICEHNSLSIIVNKLNNYVKYGLFVNIFLGPPALETTLYITLSKETGYYLRISLAILLTFTAILSFLINYMPTQVSKEAHLSYSLINSISVKQSDKFSIKEKLKICSFIEKLSGPVIGFYCYDLFPMTSFEFYEYVINSIKMYFLIIEFL